MKGHFVARTLLVCSLALVAGCGTLPLDGASLDGLGTEGFASRTLHHVSPAVMAIIPDARYTAVGGVIGWNDARHIQKLDKLVDGVAYRTHPQDQARDSRGATMLDNLYRIATTPRAGGISNHTWLLETLDVLVRLDDQDDTTPNAAGPNGITQGTGHGTCGAASAEFVMASRFPLELSGLIEGLSSPAGSVRTASGATLALNDTNALAPDASTRSDVDRVLQSVFMDHANLLLDYANDGDTGSWWSDFKGDSGMTLSGMRSLLADLTNQSLDDESCYVWGEQDTFDDDVVPHLKQGQLVPFAMNFGGGHFMVATGLQFDSHGKPSGVVCFNPWGRYDSGQTADGEPARTLVNDASGKPLPGMVVFSASKFVQQLDGAVYFK